MIRTHRLGAVHGRDWEETLNSLGVKGGEVEVRIGLGVKRPTKELMYIRYSVKSIVAIRMTRNSCWCFAWPLGLGNSYQLNEKTREEVEKRVSDDGQRGFIIQFWKQHYSPGGGGHQLRRCLSTHSNFGGTGRPVMRHLARRSLWFKRLYLLPSSANRCLHRFRAYFTQTMAR